MSERCKKMPAETNGGHKHKNDGILIFILLILMISFGAFYFFFRGEGDLVTVKTNGIIFGVYSLAQERTVEIQTEQGRNVLIIRDGKAWVSEADCPDGICSAHPAISREGESIVCLPNRVVITIEATKHAPDIIV